MKKALLTLIAVLKSIQAALALAENYEVNLILLCHKRSRTFTVAQYGQCPKALASATLN